MSQVNLLESFVMASFEALEKTAYSPRYLDYLVLLNKWNKAYNLTAIREMNSMATKHILDSLAVLPYLKGEKIIDVGTGPGLPGIPLAIAKPDINFYLLDSNGKKIRFLHEVKRSLALENIEIVHSRVEAYQPLNKFDTIISRAFSRLEQMVGWTRHLINDEGIWVAMKGHVPHEELAQMNAFYEIKSYKVPGIEGERCCIIMKNSSFD